MFMRSGYQRLALQRGLGSMVVPVSQMRTLRHSKADELSGAMEVVLVFRPEPCDPARRTLDRRVVDDASAPLALDTETEAFVARSPGTRARDCRF